jgi:transcriptional regulator with XRE-family HTH domain
MLLERKYTFRKIAEATGLGEDAVSGLAKKLSVKSSGRGAEERLNAIARHFKISLAATKALEGMSLSDMAPEELSKMMVRHDELAMRLVERQEDIEGDGPQFEQSPIQMLISQVFNVGSRETARVVAGRGNGCKKIEAEIL